MKKIVCMAVVISMVLLNGCSNDELTTENSKLQSEVDRLQKENSYYSSAYSMAEQQLKETSSSESNSTSDNGFNDYKIPKENMEKIVYTLSLPDSKKTSEYECEDDCVNARFCYYNCENVKNVSCYINFKSDVSTDQSAKYILGFRVKNADTIFDFIKNEEYSDIVFVFCDINGNANAVWLCGISDSGEEINDFISLDEIFFDVYKAILNDDTSFNQAIADYGESRIKFVGEQPVDESVISADTPAQIIETQESETTLEEISETPIIYTGSTLKVGVDIPAGEYVIFKNAGSSQAYMGVYNDANGDDIYFNENFSYNTIVTIEDGQYLRLSRCYAVPFSEATVDASGSGMFKVGTHIAAGEYKISLNDSESSGYYAIYSDSTQQDIIANDNFDSDTYVSVKDGEYLVLSRCHLVQ